MRVWDPGGARPVLGDSEIGVWLVELDSGLESQEEIDDAEPGPELSVLDVDESARAARFVRARDRRRFARCRAALREILGALLNQSPASLRFRAVARGKPQLDQSDRTEEQPPLRFNLSHSASLAAIAVCRGYELGIDLEQIRPIGEAERIVASFFSEAEQAEFATIPDEARPIAFLRGWTRKEAILKGFGVGIAGLASRHETGFGIGELATEFRPAAPNSCLGEWRLWEASPRAGFVVTLACQFAAARESGATVGSSGGTLSSALSPSKGQDSVN
jgi:4'-phosphopantetheinyl transferase